MRATAAAISSGRRELLSLSGSLAALAIASFLPASRTLAEQMTNFGAHPLQRALQVPGSVPATASQIVLKIPEIAENGAAVPVSVESTLSRPLEILLLVEANPVPLAARFAIPEDTESFLSLRIKLAESSKVYAVVKAADGHIYWTVRETQVTVGGCA